MILSYTIPNAEDTITRGIKIHTVRLDPANRWKPGYLIHHATGMRSPAYNCFLETRCVSVQSVLIVLVDGVVKITIDRRRLDKDEVEQFAVNDGFANSEELKAWFFKIHGRTMFAGKIIHWTDKKY